MAEAVAAVGLIASIGSLIDLGVKVASRIHEFNSKTSDVPEEFRRLAQRLPLLNPTLRLIQRQAEARNLSAEVSAALRSLIESTLTQLEVVETCLLKVTPPSDASHIRRTIKALRSLTKDSEIQLMIGRIHKDIDILILHQTTQHVDASDQILAILAQLQQGQVQNPSLSHLPGHAFGNIVASGNENVHLGDTFHMHQNPEADTLKVFGLRLTSAPLIEPDNFIGRTKELEEMKRVLRPGETSVEQRRVLLGGLGGIGKTQLAIAYARQHHASYNSVLWLNATSKHTLLASFRSIAVALLPISSTTKLDDEEVFANVFRWLSDEKNARWLLIYDNYDELDQFVIMDYLPNTCNGTIIITTRLPDLLRGQRMPQVRVLPVENLNEAVQILQSRSQRENVQQGRRFVPRQSSII